MITTSYDPQADAFYLRLAPKGTAIADTTEVAPDVMLDFDSNGRLVGIEVLAVQARWPEPITGAEPGNAVQQARALVRQYVPEDVSLSDELIRERRAEAARE